MTISTTNGTKGPNDKIILYNDKPITIKEVAEVLLMLWNNEDGLYPPPRFKGAKMSVDFLMEVYEKREITEDMLRKYKLKK